MKAQIIKNKFAPAGFDRALQHFRVGICVVALVVVLGPSTLATARPVGGNYYEFVQVSDPFSGENNSWFAAKAAAEARTYNGVNGHLATVTSQAENDFLFSLVSGSFSGFQGAWLGGKAPEGWLVGPENGMAFSYTRWGGAEPNNMGYAYMNIGTTFAGIGPGFWADDSGVQGVPDPTLDPVIGYFVEYENAVPFALSAVSRKAHGGAGSFDVDLPLLGTPGVECRTGGATNDYEIVFTFGGAVTFNSASVTSGMGSVSSSSGGGTNTVTVSLTGVTNAQRITVTLSGVNNGTTTGDVSVQMGVLIGDTSGNGTVSASDIGQTKTQSGQVVNTSNFRTDVNASGTINASDIGQVKAQSGTSLP